MEDTYWEQPQNPASVNIWNEEVEGQASCPCVEDHNPNPTTFDRHHIVPLSWDGPDNDANLVILCPSMHRNVHLLLNKWRDVGGEPSWEYRKYFGHYARKLAEIGYKQWRAMQ